MRSKSLDALCDGLHPSHASVVRKGYAAGCDVNSTGSKHACPYLDLRKPDGRLTYSRHWRRLWFSGYDLALRVGAKTKWSHQ